MQTAANQALWRGHAKYTDATLDADRWLGELAELGFEGVELAGADTMIGTPAETLALCAKHGLAIAAYASNVTWNPFAPNVERWQGDLRYAKELGVETIMTCGGIIPSPRRNTYPADYDMFASSIGPMVEMASELGLTIAFHPHRGSCVETTEETALILGRVPELKLCIDTGHLEAVGSDVPAFIERFGDRIVYTHIKDYHWGRDSFAELGEGDGQLDVAAALRALQAQGYDGWLTFELDQKWDDERPPAKDSAGRGLVYMREAWGASVQA